MRTISSNSARRIAVCAVSTALALALSFIEAILPLEAFIPVPGFKLGLANIAVTYVFFFISPIDAAAVSLARLALGAVLFGGIVSFGFSAAGALTAYLSMWLCLFICRKSPVLSWFGVCVASAASHNIGQLAAAVALYGIGAAAYLPWLLAISAATGLLTGLILCIISGRTGKYISAMFPSR